MTQVAAETTSELQQQLDRATRRAEGLRQMIEAISAELALGPLLTRIVECAVELLDAQYGSIGLVVETPAGPVVRVAAIYAMPLEELGAEMPAGVGLAGRVLRDRRPLILARYGDLEEPTLPDLAEHAVIGVPIWQGETLIGFFGIGVEPPQRFDEQDGEALGLFARHAAIAIENARRFESERRRAARMAAINQVGRLIAGRLSLHELLPTVVEALYTHLDFRNTAILLVDPDDPQQLVLRARGGIYTISEIGEYRQRIDHGIIGAAAQRRQRLLINDVWNDPRYIPVPGAPHMRAELSVPIVAADRLLGMLNIESPSIISEEDAESVATIADQLAIAIENARLFEAERRRAARIAVINQIGRQIAGSLSPEIIFQNAVEAIHEQLGFAYVGVGIIDPDEPETIALLAHAGQYAPLVMRGARQSIDVGLIGAVIRERRRMLINDVRNDPRYMPIPGADDLCAELVVPISIGESLLGALNIEATRPISEEDAAGVEIIADQLGIALDNAHRYREVRERNARLALIAQLGQHIAARLDPDELFAHTVEDVHRRLGYDHVALFMVDPHQPGWLVQQARASRWPRGVATGYRQSFTQGVLGAAARMQAVQVVNDVQSDRRFIEVPNADEMRAEVAVPIMVGDRLLGVLDVAGRRRFRPEDVTGIQVIADQLAVAIDHARLFERTQRALAETRLLYETSRRISMAMNVEEVVTAYLEQVAMGRRYACSIVLTEFDERGLQVAKTQIGRWAPAEGLDLTRWRLVYGRDSLDPPLDAGQTVTMSDVRSQPLIPPQLLDVQMRQQRYALAFIPLITQRRRLGVIVLSNAEPHDWPEELLWPYQVTAAQLATAIDSREQHLLLAKSGQQLAVLEERRRLARELHDSVTQSLFSMSLLTQVLPELWAIDQNDALASLHQVRDLTRGALAEMRALLFELRPAALGQQELVQAIREYVTNFEERTGLQVTFTVAGTVAHSAPVEEAIFRIIQEALTNVARHAQARSVQIELAAGPPLSLTISDDGRGFDTRQIAEGHFGMVSMRERAVRIGANLIIDTATGRGTIIRLTMAGVNA